MKVNHHDTSDEENDIEEIKKIEENSIHHKTNDQILSGTGMPL
jgi:hypothetical protein